MVYDYMRISHRQGLQKEQNAKCYFRNEILFHAATAPVPVWDRRGTRRRWDDTGPPTHTHTHTHTHYTYTHTHLSLKYLFGRWHSSTGMLWGGAEVGRGETKATLCLLHLFQHSNLRSSSGAFFLPLSCLSLVPLPLPTGVRGPPSHRVPALRWPRAVNAHPSVLQTQSAAMEIRPYCSGWHWYVATSEACILITLPLWWTGNEHCMKMKWNYALNKNKKGRKGKKRCLHFMTGKTHVFASLPCLSVIVTFIMHSFVQPFM